MKEDNEYIEEWSAIYQKIVIQNRQMGRECAEAADFSNNIMANYCENLIVRAKEAYYKTQDPIMSDLAYDRIERNLKILRPDSKMLEKVGS